ncbi:hypothetical protein [Paenibacillus sp. 23TSA30-6]|uniref:hypothetical protein n=1 Tax=Paenibacillus sp. 23TSA30-6 TaxID=2546104 RepID=UPI001787F677|nr:hypothetical protein [Paenibacillus sp. 23TSA30-6]MBE0335084.1 hypothetical protein [Paenibacillus sp. 23TSA30-6]
MDKKEIEKIREIKQYIQDIQRYGEAAKGIADDSPGALMQKVELLTKSHTLMGRVCAYMNGRYMQTYNRRKRVFAETVRDTKRGNKQNAAELAVLAIRDKEAKDLEHMVLWKNEFKSISEQLYELRLRLRVDMHIGGGGA